jgi:hypothetical protein
MMLRTKSTRNLIVKLCKDFTSPLKVKQDKYYDKIRDTTTCITILKSKRNATSKMKSTQSRSCLLSYKRKVTLTLRSRTRSGPITPRVTVQVPTRQQSSTTLMIPSNNKIVINVPSRSSFITLINWNRNRIRSKSLPHSNLKI